MVLISDLERRARMYAALGEPSRLAIVDRLFLADAAPGDLGRGLHISTNLVAHHLGVMEEAGLIRRLRSEGDRRRTYVRLRLDDPLVRAFANDAEQSAATRIQAIPGPSELTSASRVVFVCTHNSARSQLASAVWKGVSATPTASAGTHPADRVHPRAVALGRRHGLRLARAMPAHTDEVLGKNDLVVAVCDNAHEELGTEETADARPRLHWSVPDPVRIDTDEAFEAAYQDIAVRVSRLAHAMTGHRARPRRGGSNQSLPQPTTTRRST